MAASGGTIAIAPSAPPPPEPQPLSQSLISALAAANSPRTALQRAGDDVTAAFHLPQERTAFGSRPTSRQLHTLDIAERRISSRSPSRSPHCSRKGLRTSFCGIPIKVAMADAAAASHDEKTIHGNSDMSFESIEAATESTPRPESYVANDDIGSISNNATELNGLGITTADDAADATEGKSAATPKPTDDSTVADSQQDGVSEQERPSHSRKTTLESPSNVRSRTRSRDGTISPRQASSRQGSPQAMRGLSGDFAVTHPPPPSTADRMNALEQRGVGERVSSPPPSAGGLARKASSGFGALLGRMGSIRKPARSPSRQDNRAGMIERRNTGASLLSADGTSTNGLASIADGPEGRPSLQDQFQSLRREQEYQTETFSQAGAGDDEQTHTPVRAQSEAGAMSPPSLSAVSTPAILKSPPLNPALPAGTASGMAAGPAELPREVNWDLWQQVVYEGPSAVARSSGAELKEAIASGIPPAIRGVVWQVLAESKNEELEQVYHTLKARGLDADQRPSTSRATSSVTMNGTSTESITSETSSVHSENSTTATSTVATPPASVDGHGPELQSKLIAEKQKREAAALQKLEKAIKRDMGSRTSYSKYTQSAGLQDGLFGVCKAYALFDEGVGYAQGINFIAMPLLFNMSEEEAFTLLVRMMSKYDLRSLFTADMPGLHLRLHLFERLLEDFEPAVYCHLKRKNVSPQLYATQWFLTLFAYRFPLQLVLRVYDLILSEGLTAILKFGIVLMQHNREALLEMKDMSQLTTFLKEKIFDVYIDKSPSASSLLDSGFFGSVTGGADRELYKADQMVADACEITISEATLVRYTLEWEETQRSEREREHELETLRLSGIALAAQVKGLEERVQKHDAEHVNMAQELVRIKVENDALLDTNEGLKLQVTELQRLLDAQPAEVEEKLKTEMDRIMQRNIEVQNENRHLKDEMDEMEHQLVNVKMLHAQTQTDHDTLKQKWSSVQALLNEKP